MNESYSEMKEDEIDEKIKLEASKKDAQWHLMLIWYYQLFYFV
jgi:hypothetical protein